MDATQLELACFSIIAGAGTAKSNFIQAIEEARQGNYAEAESLIAAGEQQLIEAHAPHTEMVQQEAAGNHIPTNILLIHAEDQMASTETFKIMAEQLIQVYHERDELKAQVAALTGATDAGAEEASC